MPILDFTAILPKTQIDNWKVRESTNKIMGGVLMVARVLPSSTGVEELDRLRALPLYWKTDVTPYQIFIGDILVPVDMPANVFITALNELRLNDIDIPREDYLELAFSTNTALDLENSVSGNARFNEFRLSFLDMGTAEFLSALDDAYYYKNRNGEYHYKENDPNSTILPSLRGIVFSRAFTRIPASNDLAVTDTSTYRTLIAKPFPIPESNAAGAVAYVLNPTCPPYWREPAYPVFNTLIHLIGGSRMQALMRLNPIPDVTPPANDKKWKNLFYAAIATIIILIILLIQK